MTTGVAHLQHGVRAKIVAALRAKAMRANAAWWKVHC
jgi:hypothetical protein